MMHFESTGLWSLKEDMSNAVPGTLGYDSEGLNLKLVGSFTSGWSGGLERYPIIRGVVDASPHGMFVTLIDGIRKESHFNMAAVSSETIWCSRAVIGTAHLPDGTCYFQKLVLRFSYLKDWVGQTGIELEALRDVGYSIKFTKPDILPFSFGHQRLTVETSAACKSAMHRAELDEDTLIVVEPIGDLSLTELGGDRIQVIQNLLSLATDEPNEIEEITYVGPQDEQGLSPTYCLVFDPMFRRVQNKTKLRPTDMLFTFKDSQSQGMNIFQRWLDFTERNSSFCTVFFANLYAEPRYLNDRFASLMRAFTLLETTGEVSERTKLFWGDVSAALDTRFGSDDGALLRNIVPTDAEIEMPFRLLRLLRENADTVGSLIEDDRGFVRSVYDTLGFFQRRPNGGRPHLDGAKLLYAMLKIRVLVKIVVLRELGFDEEAVRSLVRRNNRINFLRTV